MLKAQGSDCLVVSANGQCSGESVCKSTNGSSVTMATGLLHTDILPSPYPVFEWVVYAQKF